MYETAPRAVVPLAEPRRHAWSSVTTIEVAVAVAAFAGLCVAALTRSVSLLEPDDYAYRASIVALSHGHLTLSTAQYQSLSKQLGGIQQWVHLPNGRWISEKNPGYPFVAVPFQLLGTLRLAPLFYGALGCLGLWFGGRKWLGRWGGAWAVAFFCSSGAALVFAWRATMPTFTDASLIAAGTGALLWTMLATDASRRRRTLVGLAAFSALEAATFSRYTDAIVLVVAVAAVLLGRRAAQLSWRCVAWWGASVAALVAVVATFDALEYGGVAKTGYTAGEITFGLSAVVPNLEHMPRHLVSAMPMLVLALGTLGWAAVRLVRSRRADLDAATRSRHRRDAAVVAALATGWVGIYALYAAYTWTTRQAASADSAVHVIRFYVPALAAVALLAAWLVQQFPRWVPVVVLAAAVILGAGSYSGLAKGGGPGGPGGPGQRGGPAGGLYGGSGTAPAGGAGAPGAPPANGAPPGP